jgi:hypothetical protein
VVPGRALPCHLQIRAPQQKSPGAGGQLDQGSRPAVALRFHAAVARAAAVRGLHCSPFAELVESHGRARNLLNGRKLLSQITSSGVTTYPFGLTALPAATTTEAAALNAEANRLRDAYTALWDLALAEGMQQAVQGNFERIAATLDAYSSGNFPPEPQVVETPPGGYRQRRTPEG